MRLQHPVIRLLAVMSLVGGMSLQAADADGHLYRWTDAQGQVHFSDQAHDNAQPLNLHLPDAGTPAPQPPANPISNNADCKKNQAQLTRYSNADTITETDSLGKTHVFTPEEKLKLIALTQAKVNKTCGADPASGSNPANAGVSPSGPQR